jgi:hypothetical protein
LFLTSEVALNPEQLTQGSLPGVREDSLTEERENQEIA